MTRIQMRMQKTTTVTRSRLEGTEGADGRDKEKKKKKMVFCPV